MSSNSSLQVTLGNLSEHNHGTQCLSHSHNLFASSNVGNKPHYNYNPRLFFINVISCMNSYGLEMNSWCCYVWQRLSPLILTPTSSCITPPYTPHTNLFRHPQPLFHRHTTRQSTHVYVHSLTLSNTPKWSQ